MFRSSAFQYVRASRGSGTRGQHIVDQKNAHTIEPHGWTKHAADVQAALGVRQSSLRMGRAHAADGVLHRNIPALRNFARQKIRLIETAVPTPAPMKRHGDNHVKIALARQSLGKQIAERLRQRPDALIFENVNQGPQRSFIRTVGENFVKARDSQAAQRASPGFVERETIEEGSAAGAAEELGFDRRRILQTCAADGNTGEFAQRIAANAAFIGENSVKKGAKSLLCGVERAGRPS